MPKSWGKKSVESHNEYMQTIPWCKKNCMDRFVSVEPQKFHTPMPWSSLVTSTLNFKSLKTKVSTYIGKLLIFLNTYRNKKQEIFVCVHQKCICEPF